MDETYCLQCGLNKYSCFDHDTTVTSANLLQANISNLKPFNCSKGKIYKGSSVCEICSNATRNAISQKTGNALINGCYCMTGYSNIDGICIPNNLLCPTGSSYYGLGPQLSNGCKCEEDYVIKDDKCVCNTNIHNTEYPTTVKARNGCYCMTGYDVKDDSNVCFKCLKNSSNTVNSQKVTNGCYCNTGYFATVGTVIGATNNQAVCCPANSLPTGTGLVLEETDIVQELKCKCVDNLYSVQNGQCIKCPENASITQTSQNLGNGCYCQKGTIISNGQCAFP